ncbi:hypothetical protein [Fluviicola sp.]|uniref:hypothetical protein n=1 Tax=Fluviicola sp. TaxID=1917219 RepID=UPI0026058B38|nr:hypothetical protein [Fluviicola sp.]
MFRLVKQLWIETADFKKPIINLGACFFEISKGGISKEVILNHWSFLMEHSFVEQVSENPPQYQFTEKGKRIQTEKDALDSISGL